MAKGKILVIDDEKDLRELVKYSLQKEGFGVESVNDGESGLAAAVSSPPDLVLVDLMMPGIDGLEVCRRLRSDNRTNAIPVVILTAKSGEPDRVVGLELGADDYVTKPFSPRELAARVKAVLRRISTNARRASVIRRGDLTIDPTRSDGPPGQVFSRSELIDGALGRDVSVVDRTIDVHIKGLRRKLGHCGECIETVRGFGYRFQE